MRKILYSLSLIIAIFTFTFVLFNLIPANPARIILGPSAPEDAVKKLEKELGLDKPKHIQFLNEFFNLLKLNFGNSTISKKPVGKQVLDRLKNSFKLIFFTLSIAILISYALNLIAFFYPKLNPVINFTQFGVILPTFVSSIAIATLISILFPNISLRYEPQNIQTLILPALILSFYPTAVLTHILHNKINEAINSDYFKSSCALGFPKNYLFHKVALKSALVSFLSAWVNLLGIAFFSTITIEIIFTIPGIGPLLVESITQKDFPTLKAIVLLNATFFIIINTIADFIYPKIDPKLKHD
jgi:peptide/nickel transport system permease protein